MLRPTVLGLLETSRFRILSSRKSGSVKDSFSHYQQLARNSAFHVLDVVVPNFPPTLEDFRDL